ncbi:MAG: hypothetical protein QME73_14470 [Bacillota bacterium]|nr:hypothetical protein [Bacillota bacterium]
MINKINVTMCKSDQLFQPKLLAVQLYRLVAAYLIPEEDLPDPPDPLDPLEQPDPPDPLDLPEPLEQPDPPDLLDPPDLI